MPINKKKIFIISIVVIFSILLGVGIYFLVKKEGFNYEKLGDNPPVTDSVLIVDESGNISTWKISDLQASISTQNNTNINNMNNQINANMTGIQANLQNIQEIESSIGNYYTKSDIDGKNLVSYNDELKIANKDTPVTTVYPGRSGGDHGLPQSAHINLKYLAAPSVSEGVASWQGVSYNGDDNNNTMPFATFSIQALPSSPVFGHDVWRLEKNT